MVHLKSEKEIESMRKGGVILMGAVKKLLPQIREGMTTNEVDAEATRLIKAGGGEVSFDKVPGYSWATCLPVNEQIVHTTPTERVLKNGDVLTVDIGVYYDGLHTDYATTVVVGGRDKASDETNRFLDVGEQALENAIAKARVGGYIGEISQSIEEDVYGAGYFILHELTGHGVGKELHEAPYVPGFLDRPVNRTYRIPSGLVIAVEVIYSMGTEEIRPEQGDDWSIVTSDGSLSACFERTIALVDKKTFILT
jgi:methionyl aminopeptidase